MNKFYPQAMEMRVKMYCKQKKRLCLTWPRAWPGVQGTEDHLEAGDLAGLDGGAGPGPGDQRRLAVQHGHLHLQPRTGHVHSAWILLLCSNTLKQ